MSNAVEKKKEEYQSWIVCLSCRFYNPKTHGCGKEHTVVDEKKQSCKEWRYVA